MTKKIAILGSNSFAGACLVARSVREGYSVLGINRSAEGSEIFLPYKQEKNKKKWKVFFLHSNQISMFDLSIKAYLD